MDKHQYVWALLRISLGLIFLWAFFDKTFGLGFTTCSTETGIQVMCDSAWLNGGRPTAGFLKFATAGPLAAFYQSIAGSAFVEWLFMLGLFGIGFSLVSGMGVKLAGYFGALLMVLMWSATLPPEHHPFLDEHIIYALVLLGLAFAKAGRFWGLGRWWSKTKIVKKYPVLE